MKATDAIEWGKVVNLVNRWTMRPILTVRDDPGALDSAVTVYIHSDIEGMAVVPVYYKVISYYDLITELYCAATRLKIVNREARHPSWGDAVGALYSSPEYLAVANVKDQT